MIKFKIHQLESFLQVADTGSFRQAAERMHRSPSAVSSHIQQLETQLDVKLLERTTRRMTLTPAGRLLLTRCQGVLAELDAAAQEVHEEVIARRGRVSIGVSPSVSRHHLLPVLARQQKTHANLSIEMHEAFAETLYSQLAEGVTDFAIGPGIAGRHDFHVRPIIKDPIVAVLPRKFPVGPTGTVALEELSEQTQICMPKGTAIRQVIERAFKAKRLPFSVKFEVMYPQGLFEMVGANLGVAMMPLLSVPPRPYRDFKIALLASSMHRDMCLITLKARKPTAPARAVAELVIRALKSPLVERPDAAAGA